MNMQCTRGDLERFWKKVKPDPKTGCWEWTGTFTSDKGDGNQDPAFWLTNQKVSARRLMHLVCFGELPKRVGCSCGNRACVAPSHLTPKRSADAVVGKNYVPRTSKNWTRVDARLVGRVLALRRQGLSQPAIARALKSSQGHVSLILKMAALCRAGKIRGKKKPAAS